MIRAVIYSKSGCRACDDLKEKLLGLDGVGTNKIDINEIENVPCVVYPTTEIWDGNKKIGVYQGTTRRIFEVIKKLKGEN